MSARPITILVCALGGEGGGMVSQWLYEAAAQAGYAAQSTSIPGVAQRTGATTYYIEVYPVPLAQLGGRRPVFSLNPVPGALDLLVSSELLETLRQVGNGLCSAERTEVISSTARALTVAEKVVPGDGRVADGHLLATLQRHSRRADLLDFAALAASAGTVVSAVLLGAIAASGVLPLPREAFEAAIRRSGKGVTPSLQGFAQAFAALQAQRTMSGVLAAAMDPATLPQTGAVPGLGTVHANADPRAGADLRALARERLQAYQDAAYAGLYEQRLARIEAAERAARAGEPAPGPATRDVTRWLALWMAFDDIAQVAQRKLAASRLARVRREVKADPDEIVAVYDHFKPGVAELAALLPPALARRLQQWDARRVAAGHDSASWPIKLGAHTVRGSLALRLMAGMRRWRRHGSRYPAEQALIERWLAAVETALAEDAALGAELAACGRLVKGYGSTQERGREQLLHIIEHLARAPGQGPAQRAAAIHRTREAALADGSGQALDRALQAHGAPPRPVPVQTVRWYKRRPTPT